jgi:hypothetical protein
MLERARARSRNLARRFFSVLSPLRRVATQRGQRLGVSSLFTGILRRAPTVSADPPALTLEGLGRMASVHATRQVGTLWDGYLKLWQYELEIERPGSGREVVRVNVASVPGPDVSLVAGFELDEHGKPVAILKHGDTRPSRIARGRPYVATGMVGGRLDHEGASALDIARAELEEEVGRFGVPGGTFELGAKGTLVWPTRALEADRYFLSIVGNDRKPVKGDGGGQELVGLIGPKSVPIQEALERMRSGEYAEGGRALVAYTRALEKMGFIPELGRYVQDLPKELRERYQTCGLGEVFDPRNVAPTRAAAHAKPAATAPDSAQPSAKDVNTAIPATQAKDLAEGFRMISGKWSHAVKRGSETVPFGKPFPQEHFEGAPDVAKVVEYRLDPQRGLQVRLVPRERPVPASQGGEHANELMAPDVHELEISLKPDELQGAAEEARVNSAVEELFKGARRMAPSVALSPGVTDARQHYFAVQATSSNGFLPISDALSLIRQAGDSGAEAALQQLMFDVGWIPGLRMSLADIQKQLGTR